MAVSLDFERARGDVVIGVDEAGRGPLAGGVYAAAVTVPLAEAERLAGGAWSGVDDSKRLTERLRAGLAAAVKAAPCCTWAGASASPDEIDRLNILRATHLAMRRAVEDVMRRLGGGAPVSVIVDGNPVEGAIIQLCDEVTCAFQPTDANGVATFSVEAQKVYDVHVLKAPEGYAPDDGVYKTLDTYSDVNIFLEKAA